MDNKWKVYCVDTFDGTNWEHGRYDTQQESEHAARCAGGVMLRAHVETPNGKRIKSYGTS